MYVKKSIKQWPLLQIDWDWTWMIYQKKKLKGRKLKKTRLNIKY